MNSKELLKLYRSGFVGSTCDPKKTDQLLGELPHPLFGAAAYDIEFSGDSKLSLPYKSVQKFDPKFGEEENQTTGDCFEGDTVVISDYCKKISDVEIGDKIYGSDGKFSTVISKQVKLSHNPIVKIKTKGSLPLSVTSDHQVMIGRKESIGEGGLATKVITRKWISAQDIKKGDYVITPIELSKDDMPINDFTIAEDFHWFLGYFLGDGWCDKKTIEITFAKHQIDFFNRCKKFLSNLGFNVKKCNYKSKKTSAFRLRCWCPKLATFMRNLSYDNKKNKIFPNWGIGNTEIVKGLVESDGFKKENKEVFNSKSTSLAYGVYYSYLNMGYKPTINYFHRSKKGAYKKSQSYRVTCIYNKRKNYSFIKNDELYIQVSNVEMTEGPHEVYDIGVDNKEHAFLANGCIAHNCVSHGSRNAIDISRAVEIDIAGESEEFVARGATEVIYGSRGFSGQGMICSEAVRFIHKQGGLMIRKNYPEINLDLSVYNASIGIKWGRSGVPDKVKEVARKNPVKTVSLISSIQEAKDACANGYGILICSNQGFSSRRDKYGICAPKGTWHHAMCVAGCDDTRERLNEELFLIVNSWARWNAGPKFHDQPEGSFWVRRKVLESMIRQRSTWALSNVDGFPARDLPDYGTSTFL